MKNNMYLVLTVGFSNIPLIPFNKSDKNFDRSWLFSSDLRTDAICTRQDSTVTHRLSGRLKNNFVVFKNKDMQDILNTNEENLKIYISFILGTYISYKLKNRPSVDWSSSSDRQLVGICTVHKSSLESSCDVPMKSNARHVWTNFSTILVSSH